MTENLKDAIANLVAVATTEENKVESNDSPVRPVFVIIDDVKLMGYLTKEQLDSVQDLLTYLNRELGSKVKLILTERI